MNTETEYLLKEYTSVEDPALKIVDEETGELKRNILTDLLEDNEFMNNKFTKNFIRKYKAKVDKDPILKEKILNIPNRLAESVPLEKGEARGQTVGDANGAGAKMQVAATLEIVNYVIRGYTRFMNDQWIKKIQMFSTQQKIPLTEYQEKADETDPITAMYPVSNKEIDYALLDVTNPESERGCRVTWTRSAIEDATFAMQAELLEGLGFAIACKIMTTVLNELFTVTGVEMPAGQVLPIATSGVTWANFVDLIKAVGRGYEYIDPNTGLPNGTRKTYGKPDYVICSSDIYYDLFKILQFTNSLYIGTTDPVATGVVKSTLGVTVVEMSMMPDGTMYAINSKKAIALGMRRELKLEPIVMPEYNRYGYIGTTRYDACIIYKGAIQCASVSGTVPNPI